MVARELEKRLLRAQRDRHGHEHGRHGHEVFERHNEENVVGIGLTVLWREARDSSDDIECNDCKVCEDAQYNSGSVHGRPLLVDFLALEPCDGSRGCVVFVRAQTQDHPKVHEVGDFNMKYRHFGRDVWWWSDEVLGDLGARIIKESGARGPHTDHE